MGWGGVTKAAAIEGGCKEGWRGWRGQGLQAMNRALESWDASYFWPEEVREGPKNYNEPCDQLPGSTTVRKGGLRAKPVRGEGIGRGPSALGTRSRGGSGDALRSLVQAIQESGLVCGLRMFRQERLSEGSLFRQALQSRTNSSLS